MSTSMMDTTGFCPCSNQTISSPILDSTTASSYMTSSSTMTNTSDGHTTILDQLNHTVKNHIMKRFLQDSDDDDDPIIWQVVVVVVTITIMFYFMITDKIYPDWVMLGGLLIFMITEIITIKEGLAGFANEGILTVLALFVVAEGLSKTGALDYYMGKILGRPTSIAGAQIRLMIPIVCISAFFNNTPIVAIMIPVTLRWAKMIGCPKQQLLIPLSYATILGGTCTLVGTSTNLVLNGLLKEDYPDEPAGNIQLFDLAVFGVPNSIIGVIYMLFFGSLILPGGRNATSGGEITLTTGEYDDLLFAARVLPWSPAAGRTVKRSGLNNHAGIYLVNVRRAMTGNIHRAVSPDFVVSAGDELYFTGTVEQFSAFCQTHGLEIITTDNIDIHHKTEKEVTTEDAFHATADTSAERLQLLNRISDQIEGHVKVEPGPRAAQIIVTRDAFHTDRAILVAVDCADRPGLLSDISDALFQRGKLEIKHTEANVVEGRSLSIWRCETIDDTPATLTRSAVADTTNIAVLDMIWTVVSQVVPDVIGTDSTTGAFTSSLTSANGIQVVRAVVTKTSNLIGKTPLLIDFGNTSIYKAAIVAYQKNNGKNASIDAPIEAGDVLVLATNEGSPLLIPPPDGYYDKKKETLSQRVGSSLRLSAKQLPEGKDIEPDIEHDANTQEVWNNLRVIFDTNASAGSINAEQPKGEFLTAFTIPPKSPLDGKTLSDLGYAKLPGVMLVSCERPIPPSNNVIESGSSTKSSGNGIEKTSTKERFLPLSPDVDTLTVGDVLWFSGSADAISDLQRIHGLAFYQEPSTPSLQERRLVQAVVARGSPLVGRTVVDVDFREVYGGVVLAIQRGSERVHDHPGVVKLQTGDVLLIETDLTFSKRQARNYKVFALVSEVEGSAPPRPKMFFISLILIFTAFACASVELQSLFVLTGIVGIIMSSLGVLTQQEARDAIQWDLFVVVASAFGVSSAMTNSGVAEGLATFLVKVGDALGIGDAGIYGAMYLAVNLLSSILTNNAAAVLAYPIAMEAVNQTGVDRVNMAFIIMLSASDYITSFGYQTNLMVYGPGEYSNMDFLKFGAPMQILLWLSSTALVSTSNPDTWYVSWFVCFLALFVAIFVRLMNGHVKKCFPKTKEIDTPEHDPQQISSWHFRRELQKFKFPVEM